MNTKADKTKTASGSQNAAYCGRCHSLVDGDTFHDCGSQNAALPAYRVIYADGTSYVTSMSRGTTLAKAQAYFVDASLEQPDGSTKRVAKVEVAYGSQNAARTFNEALQHAKETIGFFANGDLSEVAKVAKSLWHAIDDVQQGKPELPTLEETSQKLHNALLWQEQTQVHAQALAEALRDCQNTIRALVEMFEDHPSWQKAEVALAKWEAGQ